MEEQTKTDLNKEEQVIIAIREEYEKKLEEQKNQFEEEKKKALEEAEEKHIKQIRALMLGRKEPEPQKDETLSFEESMLQALRNKNHLNKGV